MNGSKVEPGAPGTDPEARGPGGMYVHESGTPGSPAIVFIHGAQSAMSATGTRPSPIRDVILRSVMATR